MQEYYAGKYSTCPYCKHTIRPGDIIVPYNDEWYHSACNKYKPRLGQGGVSRHTAHVQQRDERIRKYHSIHQWMSIRELAEYLGYSKSTVHRVLTQQ